MKHIMTVLALATTLSASAADNYRGNLKKLLMESAQLAKDAGAAP